MIPEIFRLMRIILSLPMEKVCRPTDRVLLLMDRAYLPMDKTFLTYGQGVPPHVQNTAPYRQTDPSVFTDEDRKKANLLCIISLACYFFIPVVGSGVSAGLASAFSTVSGSSGAVDYLYNIITGIGSISWIAAWVLMIYVRVRYSKSIFGKVLMWVYISFIVIKRSLRSLLLSSHAVKL